MILPAANMPDLQLLPDEVREGLQFVPVRDMDQVLATALPAVAPASGRELPDDPGISLSQ
jgi:ATP-dependent Lon protease